MERDGLTENSVADRSLDIPARQSLDVFPIGSLTVSCCNAARVPTRDSRRCDQAAAGEGKDGIDVYRVAADPGGGWAPWPPRLQSAGGTRANPFDADQACTQLTRL